MLYTLATNAFANRSKGGNWLLWPCEYRRDVQKKSILEFVDAAIHRFDGYCAHGTAVPAAVSQTIQGFGKQFLVLAPTFKHSSFAEEQEWRVVSQPFEVDNKAEKFREGRSFLVPYREFPLKLADGTVPITEVVVGPGPHMGLAAATIREFLEKHGLTSARVRKSKIPFRYW